MSYSVKEMYLTLQGEGVQTGIAAVFLRFSGCNLWSGREQDRQSAICKFCDTDFIGTDGPGGGKFKNEADLVDAVDAQWQSKGLANKKSTRGETTTSGQKWVVCTGGEPLLQLGEPLIQAFHKRGFKVAVETNGTIKAPASLDWICVSPKADAALRQISGQELKLVYPQKENTPDQFTDLAFDNFCLQPLDDAQQTENIQKCIRYCLENPLWRLSLQTHKVTGIA